MAEKERLVRFTLGGMVFEYDEVKNQQNIKKHGISFKVASRVFFDYDRLEEPDKKHSLEEDRYITIGNPSTGNVTVIGNVGGFTGTANDILFVVYTDREIVSRNGEIIDITRLISARLATRLERKRYDDQFK